MWLVVAQVFLPTVTVQAAPKLKEGGDISSVPVPLREERITVTDGAVVLDLRRSVHMADVTATYTLRYDSDGPLTIPVAIALVTTRQSGGHPVEVVVDGEIVPVSISSRNLQHGEGLHTAARHAIEWRGADTLYGDRLYQVLTTFELAWDGPGEKELRLAYNQTGAYSSRARKVYYEYLLQPAAQWASFGQLDAELLLPGDWKVESNVPLTQVVSMSDDSEGTVWRGKLASLPHEDLHISVNVPKGVLPEGWGWRHYAGFFFLTPVGWVPVGIVLLLIGLNVWQKRRA